MTTTAAADFERHLDEHPCDWACRLAYADFLEERGRSGALERWMAARRKAPAYEPGRWCWWSRRRAGRSTQTSAASYLPPSVHQALGGFAGPDQSAFRWKRWYYSRKAAEEALGRALTDLGEL